MLLILTQERVKPTYAIEIKKSQEDKSRA